MINANEGIAAFVRKLRAIPELVAEMDGDPDNIRGYYDRFPDSANLREAILSASEGPCILVIWMGSSVGAGYQWRHRYQMCLFAKREYPGDDPRGPAKLWELIVNGITESGRRLIDDYIHPDCDHWDVPTTDRVQLVVDDAGNTVDYFAVYTALPEVGDN